MEPGAGDDVRERVAAVKRWFDNDWQKLDNKIKSSIVEGVSVFLSMFDMPDVAAVFCPPPPEVSDDPRRIGPKARAAMLAEKKAKAKEKAQAEQAGDEDRAEGAYPRSPARSAAGADAGAHPPGVPAMARRYHS